MAILAPQSSVANGPPLTGWMEKFEPAADPVPAPLTPFVDKTGRKLTLKDFRGRLVLVNFWATWCGPCVREMPGLDRLQAKLGGPAFTVLALSEDRRGWEKIGPFAKRLALGNLPLFHDEKSGMMFAAKVRGLPATLLIGRDGSILGRLTGPAEWDSPEAIKLIEYFSNNQELNSSEH